jgi:hypothetical protein
MKILEKSEMKNIKGGNTFCIPRGSIFDLEPGECQSVDCYMGSYYNRTYIGSYQRCLLN